MILGFFVFFPKVFPCKCWNKRYTIMLYYGVRPEGSNVTQVFKVGLQPCSAGIWLNFFDCGAKRGKFSKCLSAVIAYTGLEGHVLAFHTVPKHCFITRSMLTVCLPSGIKFELYADESWWDMNANRLFAPPGLEVLTGCWQQPWPTSIAESRY